MRTYTLLFAIILLRLGNLQVHSQVLTIKEPVRFLALGDSYTIGQSVAVKDRWPEQLMSSLSAMGIQTESLRIIAQTGWRTDNLKNAIDSENLTGNYNLVSLLIGVNDQFQGYETDYYSPRFENLLLTALELAGGDKSSVFVLSIPDYAYTPFGQSYNPSLISAEINDFNLVNRSITQDLGISYYDITPISRLGNEMPALVASDGLHPSGQMYGMWVSLITENIVMTSNDPGSGTGTTDILVYPNPASGYITFTSSLGDYTIRIHNTSGVLVAFFESKGMQMSRLDITRLDPGIYFWTVDLRGGETRQGKFIKT